ncbi:hypothetical protein JCM9957A_21050 [Kineosporia succinea]
MLLALLIDTLGTGMFGPMVLLYFHLVADLPLAQVGALASAAAGVGLAVPLFAGQLADQLSPRTLVISGQLIQALGYCGFLVAREPVAVFGSFVLTTAGLRVFWSTYFTMISALPGVRERLFAVTGTVQAIGFGSGALIGGLLVASESPSVFRAALLVNVVSYVLAALLLTQVPMVHVPSGSRESGIRTLLHDRAFLGLIAVDAGFAVCSDALVVGLPIALKEGSMGHVGVLGPLLALNTLVIAAAQLMVARAIGGLSRVHALVLAGLIWSGWALLMAVLPRFDLLTSSLLLVGLVLVYTVAEMIHVPVANALAAEAAPQEHRGIYLAGFQYGFALAHVVVPGAFTALFAVGQALPWLVIGGLALVATAGAAALGRHLPAVAVQPAGQPVGAKYS